MTDTQTMAAHDKQPTGVFAAIAAITAELAREGISKDRKNQAQGYSFRGIEDVYRQLAPLLARHGLCIIPVTERRIETERTAKGGGTIYSVAVRVRFNFHAQDGSYANAVVWGEAMDSADKATNKAMSAAYKYMAFMTFCIPVEGTDDADAHTPPPTQARSAPKPKGEPKPAPPFDLADEAVAAVLAATSTLALDIVGHRIRASGFQGEDLEHVRAVFKERQQALGGGA